MSSGKITKNKNFAKTIEIVFISLYNKVMESLWQRLRAG